MAKKEVPSKVTIVEVAERAGVSLGTVSRVMNNDIHVAPDARERVVAEMREMGYVAHLVKGMVDGLVLILPRNPADYMGLLKNANFPFVLIDHQGAVPLSRSANIVNNRLSVTWQEVQPVH